MKIIGKLLFSLLLLSAKLGASCDLTVKLFGYSGEPITKVVVGVPFQMHVIGYGDCDIETVKFGSSFDLCHLNSLGVIKSLSSINGVNKREITHKYLARIDYPGQYRLGPIEAWAGSQLIGQSQILVDAYEQAFDLNQRPALELRASKTQFYLGEQINLVIRLYLDSMQLTTPNLNLPQDWHDKLDIVTIGSFTRGATGSKQYLEWQIGVIAKSVGKIMLPAISVVFEKVSQKNSFFMFNNKEQIVRFSNIIKLDVIDLPPTDRVVQGIGEFYDLRAKVDHEQITVSRAAQVQLELTGSAACNWSKIVMLELANLPSNLQAYQGPILQIDQHKRFEFILQGLELGKCVVPAQSFYYFDTNDKQYKTLYTKPLELQVMSIYNLPTNSLETSLVQVIDTNIDQNIKPILTSININYNKNIFIPSWLFFLISLLPGLMLFLIWLINFYINRAKASLKNRVNNFEKKLSTLIKNNQPELVYDFFRQIFVELFGFSKVQIDLKQITNLLKQQNISEQEIKNFILFYEQLISLKFGKLDQLQIDYTQLFAQAHYWLFFLGKLTEK